MLIPLHNEYGRPPIPQPIVASELTQLTSKEDKMRERCCEMCDDTDLKESVLSVGGMKELAMQQREICELCDDQSCNNCCASFMHKGKTGKVVRVYLRNQRVERIECT